MSVHYISMRALLGSAGIEVIGRATEGPDPILTLLAGYRRLPGRRAAVSREINKSR